MRKPRRNLKRAYRIYFERATGDRPRGVLDRRHCEYMGYTVPLSFKAWCRELFGH